MNHESEFKEAAFRAITAELGVTGLAAALSAPDDEVTVQTVSNWRVRGIPPNRCKAIEAATGVSVKALRTDWAQYWPELQAA